MSATLRWTMGAVAAATSIALLATTLPVLAEPPRAPAAAPAVDDPYPATCGTLTIPASLDGLKPGDLVDDTIVVPGVDDSTGLPLLTGAQTWRILYVSMGVDESTPQLVCGLVAAPQGWTPDGDGRGRVVAWAHGTVGIKQMCQPSNNPDGGFFGKMPGGIGAVAWASDLGTDAVSGLPANGALQTLIDRGYVVAATDYFSGITPGSAVQGAYQPYAAGVPSGANVLDSVRAAVALVDPEGTATRWDMLTWGHSQGGGSAIWAGQLARTYLARTSPTEPIAPIRLVGVAAAAPATSFLAPGTRPTQYQGFHLGDRDMHRTVSVLGVPLLNIGTILFSYVLVNWQQLSTQATTPGSRFRAKPNDTALDLSWMLATTAPGSNVGVTVAPEMAKNCLNTRLGAETLALLSNPFARRPDNNWFFVQQIWGRPETQYKVGYLDQTCATTDDTGIRSWCRWLRFNNPGPNGQNPYDKVPRNDRGVVPMYVMQGEGDEIIYCLPADQGNPTPQECLSRQFVDTLRPAYCPRNAPAGGSLQFDAWPIQITKNAQGAITSYRPSTHMSIPGQAAAPRNFTGVGTNLATLRFTDSKLWDFMDRAFNAPGSLPRGCSQTVMFVQN